MPSNDGLEREIRRFMAALRSGPTLSDDALIGVLVRDGVDRVDAERSLAFIPMAFEHERLYNRGAVLPTEYEVRDLHSGLARKGVLSRERLYTAARVFARTAGLEHPDVVLVAERSAEAAVVRELRCDPAQIVFTEPVLLRLPIQEDGSSRRPWWRRWIGGAG